MIAPQVGRVFNTEGGYKAIITIDFLETEKKIDELGCRYGGYLLTPGKDTYCWWKPDGSDPRRLDSSLISLYEGEHDPVFQPITEPHLGVVRAQGYFYTRLEDLKKDWGGKVLFANRMQRTPDGIVSHVISL